MRDHVGVVVADGRKDPVGYEALFAIDPGMRNLGVSFLIRDYNNPESLRLEFAQQVEIDEDTRPAPIAYRLVCSMDAWLKNWNKYNLRSDVHLRLQRIIVVIEQQYFSSSGDLNPAMVSFVHCLEAVILATRPQTQFEFKMIVVSPEGVRRYCGLPKTKKHAVRKAQTKAFVEGGLGTTLERHDVADSIALAITALKGGKNGRVRLVPVEIGNTDFLFSPPDEPDELTEVGAKGFLHVDEEDPGIPNGDDLEAGLSAGSGQSEEAASSVRPHARTTCRDDGPQPDCGICVSCPEDCSVCPVCDPTLAPPARTLGDSFCDPDLLGPGSAGLLLPH